MNVQYKHFVSFKKCFDNLTERESGLFHVTLKMAFSQVVKHHSPSTFVFRLNYKYSQLDLTT